MPTDFSNRHRMDRIAIGICLRFEEAIHARQMAAFGFESVALLHKGLWFDLDWEEEVRFVRDHLPIASIGFYANPMMDPQAAHDLRLLLERGPKLGIKTVGCFTGASPDQPIDEQIRAFTKLWGELARVAEDHGVRIGFEGCTQGGTWQRPTRNLALNSRAWSMLFDAVPSPALGLEWEPAHAITAMADPMRQLDLWGHRIVHVHGKDARVDRDRLREYGMLDREFAVVHKLPGYGQSDWHAIIERLDALGFAGSISIEGGHDRAFKGELEWTGWIQSLAELRRARGGHYVQVQEDLP